MRLNNKPLTIDNRTIPSEILRQELPYMLPKMPMIDPAEVKDYRADKYSCIIYRQNKYSVPDRYTGKMVFVKAYADKIKMYYENTQVAEHVRTFGVNDWNIKLEHYLDTLHKKSGALGNSTAMLKLDTKIKNIYDKYYTENPKGFLDLYEIILDKGLNVVEQAIDELVEIVPTNITTDKIELLCNKEQLPIITNYEEDEISKISAESLIQYALLIPNSSIIFEQEEVLV